MFTQTYKGDNQSFEMFPKSKPINIIHTVEHYEGIFQKHFITDFILIIIHIPVTIISISHTTTMAK